MRWQVRANATMKDGSAHVGPYDAVLGIIKKGALEAAGRSGSGAAHFAAYGAGREST